MQRRELIIALGATAAAWPLLARGQQQSERLYRIGWLTIGSRRQQIHLMEAFEVGLQSLGYRVGYNVAIEYRFADGEMERLPALAADLVRFGVDVIVTGNLSLAATMKATATIPIVVPNSVDPVNAGLITSLARPGGNVTGLSQDTGGELNGKRLELLKETLQNPRRVGILFNPKFAPNRSRLTTMRDASRALALELIPAEAPGLDGLEDAFATMLTQRAQGVVVLGDSVLFNYRSQIGAMTIRNRLPAISAGREFAEAGLLLTYGVDFRDLFRRSSVVVDKIFKGAKPADLPVEQPTKLALAAIYDGATRTEAAKIGGVTLQIIRDWVMRFNALGPDGLIDRKPPGQPSRLNGVQRQAIVRMIESGPIPAIHGVVRWRLVDLSQ